MGLAFSYKKEKNSSKQHARIMKAGSRFEKVLSHASFQPHKAKAVQIRFQEGPSTLTFRNVTEYLIRQDRDFLEVWVDAFRDLPDFRYEGYFFECPPMNQNYLDEPFEMALTNTTDFECMRPNTRAFETYFERDAGEAGTVFASLGKDAWLIAPIANGKPNKNYAHFARFMRTTDMSQQGPFWKIAMKAFMKQLEKNRTIWLSTDGTGIHWVHVRLDSRPKYYDYEPYCERVDEYWEAKRQEMEQQLGNRDRDYEDEQEYDIVGQHERASYEAQRRGGRNPTKSSRRNGRQTGW